MLHLCEYNTITNQIDQAMIQQNILFNFYPMFVETHDQILHLTNFVDMLS
jgi:hypothetical protein